MQLTEARITNYRSIEDSGPFKIDRVTCFVGKNESGKTALLQALYKLNPYLETGEDFDILRDYPRRHHADYAERHPDGKAVAIHTTWTLESDDTKELVAVIGPEGEKIKQIAYPRASATRSRRGMCPLTRLPLWPTS